MTGCTLANHAHPGRIAPSRSLGERDSNANLTDNSVRRARVSRPTTGRA